MSSLALSYVVNLLARREYSEFELRNKMQEKAFTEDEIDETIAHCQKKKTGKMINDLLKIIYMHVRNVDMVQIVLNKNYVN